MWASLYHRGVASCSCQFCFVQCNNRVKIRKYFGLWYIILEVLIIVSLFPGFKVQNVQSIWFWKFCCFLINVEEWYEQFKCWKVNKLNALRMGEKTGKQCIRLIQPQDNFYSIDMAPGKLVALWPLYLPVRAVYERWKKLVISMHPCNEL